MDRARRIDRRAPAVSQAVRRQLKGSPMPARDIDKQWNRDDEQKPGAPPRTAHEPKGSEGSTRTDKTLTDPASGEPNAQPPAPNRAGADRKPGR
jgi:hypothetical protein